MEPEGSFLCSQESSLTPVLSQMNPVHNLPPYSFDIHFNIILLSTLISPKWFPSFKFSPMHATCPAHILRVLIALITFDEEDKCEAGARFDVFTAMKLKSFSVL
jgi:hypothetical protein